MEYDDRLMATTQTHREMALSERCLAAMDAERQVCETMANMPSLPLKRSDIGLDMKQQYAKDRKKRRIEKVRPSQINFFIPPASDDDTCTKKTLLQNAYHPFFQTSFPYKDPLLDADRIRLKSDAEIRELDIDDFGFEWETDDDGELPAVNKFFNKLRTSQRTPSFAGQLDQVPAKGAGEAPADEAESSVSSKSAPKRKGKLPKATSTLNVEPESTASTKGAKDLIPPKAAQRKRGKNSKATAAVGSQLGSTSSGSKGNRAAPDATPKKGGKKSGNKGR